MGDLVFEGYQSNIKINKSGLIEKPKLKIQTI